MTELENKIYDCAMLALPDAKQKAETMETTARYIILPFNCDGCVNYLVYDSQIKKFIKIKYFKGIGNGTTVNPFNQFSASFYETELCEIDII